jgi:hypothetical protein
MYNGGTGKWYFMEYAARGWLSNSPVEILTDFRAVKCKGHATTRHEGARQGVEAEVRGAFKL